MNTVIIYPANPDEVRQELAIEEKRFEDGLYQAGLALERIRDKRLYRCDYSDFNSYCQDRLNLSRTHVDRQISARRVIDVLRGVTEDLPEKEAHTRELAGMSDAEIKLVWQVVKECSVSGKVTANDIRGVASIFKEIALTGAIDDGSGNQIPIQNATVTHFKAAVTEELYERMERQRQHLKDRGTNNSDNGLKWSKEQTGLIRCIEGKWYLLLETGLPELDGQEISYKLKLRIEDK